MTARGERIKSAIAVQASPAPEGEEQRLAAMQRGESDLKQRPQLQLPTLKGRGPGKSKN